MRWVHCLIVFALCFTGASLAAADPTPGGIHVIQADGTIIPMPLVDLAVNARVTGNLAEVTVEQTYENPFDARVEAVYVFPLTAGAAVNEMVMVIGDRRIRAEIQEREEARQTYEEARDRGETAALLEQERPDVFTQSIANIEPGHPVRVLIRYVEQVHYEDRAYHLDFPLTVGPRFAPGEPLDQSPSGTGVLADTDVVPDAARITPAVLPAGVDAPYEVDFHLLIEAPMTIRELTSTSHNIEADWLDEGTVEITLPDDQRQPDRDVVISYELASDDVEIGMLSHEDERGGFFSLMIEPPLDFRGEVRSRELVFVLDMSGSMGGQPMEVSKETIRYALENMGPDDTFQIVRFSDNTDTLAPTPLANTPANLARATAYLDALEAGGGTYMEGGVRAALEPAVTGDRMRVVLFLTDGYIGYDRAVLALVNELVGSARIHSLGVGHSPNRHLLERLAEVGHGLSYFVNLNESPNEVID
ncbi:MAG: VWA domain-containing protein, partial [Myxococcales bacterium]|nr:VWA domain-containing protein [Myxococcales bacterium]